jgi:hypothetical protein
MGIHFQNVFKPLVVFPVSLLARSGKKDGTLLKVA